jgi:ligand-binding sensor domain-containing protein
MAKLYAQETVYKNTLIYSQKQGLSSPNIHKIIQDKYGFIWIATQDGLNRFDGNEFVKYNYDQKRNRQLYSSDIRDLIIDNKAGLLWVICNQGGINKIDLATGSCLEAYPYPKNDQNDEWKICATYYDNNIFIGTSGGLEVFNILSGSFITTRFIGQCDKICREAFNSDIRTIQINKNGLMAIGLLDKGVFFYEINKQTGFLITQKNGQKLFKNNFWPLCGQFINDGLYYCGTQNGLCKIDYKNRWIIDSTRSLFIEKLGPVTAIMMTDKNEIILAGDKLAGINTGHKSEYFIRPNFYEAESWLKNITSIFQDDKSNLWIGSRQGLCLVKNHEPVFRAVKNNPDLYSNKLGHVFSLCIVNDSSILAGTKDGLFVIDRNFGLKQLYNKGLVQNIVRITSDIFIISGYNGSALFTNSKIQSLSAKFPELTPYQNWQFNSFVKVNDSISLLGTESNNGVLKWNTHTSTISLLNTKSAKNERLPSDIVNSIFINSSGVPVILSDFFISTYNPIKQSVQVYKINDDQVHGIYMQMEEAAGNYWIAAYGTGLIKTDQNFKLKKVYRSDDGLSNSGLYSIFNYKDSILFLTSNFGISVFNIKSEKFSRYYEEDGLQNNTFEEACRDTLKGIFFAGGTDGFVKIIPQNMVADEQPPVLYFTKTIVEGSSVTYIDSSNLTALSFTVPSQSAQVKIFFSGLHYQNPARVIYEYKIKELGNYWIKLNNQNFVTLIGLSPGKYHLKVRAANEDAVWSNPKELVLVFLPKWYQSWQFKLLVFLTTLGIIYAFYRYRIRQIEKQHAIRKNIATDLHDDLGSTLNSVKVFTNLAISGVKQEESLQQIKDNLNEATMGLRDMIWVLDDSLDTVDELVTRLKQYAIPVAGASNIESVIKAESEVNNRQLTKEEKRNLFLVCKEAINNSIKYSGATRINVTIAAYGKKIQILVTDNGKGFNVDEVKKGYGLKNMQYRAGQIKYRVSLISNVGNGTQITIQPS